ncbi:hypothetical protein Q3H58_004542 [Pseudomonas psychrotolerans]|nr:hypothetical protein [Pseudomonas psychrotolerans]
MEKSRFYHNDLFLSLASATSAPDRDLPMIISSASDYRAAAKRKLPRFLFDYIDGGAYAEHTLGANTADLSSISLRQRILRKVDDLSLETTLFGQSQALPVVLSPVGLTGMYARRGEVQAAKAAAQQGDPFLSVHRLGLPARRGRRPDPRAAVVPALCAQGPWLHAQRTGTGPGGRRHHPGVHRRHAHPRGPLSRCALRHVRPLRRAPAHPASHGQTAMGFRCRAAGPAS